jgi:hypothetical protein
MLSFDCSTVLEADSLMRMAPIGKLAIAMVAVAGLSAMSVSTCANSAEEASPVDIGVDADSSLRSRIGPPDLLVLETYAISGATNVRTHRLTNEEWKIFDAALARLPDLHRRILERHLKRLTFLDLEPGSGSALASRVGLDENSKIFAITLRASLLEETLTEFLNTKEAKLFVADASKYRIRFDAGSSDALTYVLLHEATHIVDQVLGLTADNTHPLMAGAWESQREPAEPHRSSLAMQTSFRAARKIPVGDAPKYYRALGETPFVSFYATAAAAEDVAELFAWQQLATRFGQKLTLSVLDGSGQVIFRYEPLDSPLKKTRFLAVEQILIGGTQAGYADFDRLPSSLSSRQSIKARRAG